MSHEINGNITGTPQEAVKMVLETREERVKLLKAGVLGKEIENLYVQLNGFKIICGNILQIQEA